MSPQQMEQQKRAARQPHNVPGQFNIYVLDVESDITNYGKHNRLLVLGGTGEGSYYITVREDGIGLPESTEQDRRRVLNGWQRQHKLGELLHFQTVDRVGKHIYYTYRRHNGSRQ